MKNNKDNFPVQEYDHNAHSYKGIDSREGRLKDIITDRGNFRIKENGNTSK